MIRFRCQECGKKLKADEEIVGRKVKCTRCDHVEKVPGSDNLSKPKQPRIKASKRLDTNKPKIKTGSFNSGPHDLIAGDEPIEMFGHSAAPAIGPDHFEPSFHVTKRKPANFRRNAILGLIGLVLLGCVVVAFNFNWILDSSRRLSTDYENLAEVVYYRKAVKNLEKSRRMMMIAGKTFIATKAGTDEEKQSLDEYNASILAQTTESDMLTKVEELFRAGKDMEAKALLVNTAVELAKVREEVDLRTKEYTESTY